jgi:hypothetical protein
MTYPNVAAEPAMYCPKVRIIPLGPGPNRMMFVAPNIKPMMMPTAVAMGQRHIWDIARDNRAYIHPSLRPFSLLNISGGDAMH